MSTELASILNGSSQPREKVQGLRDVLRNAIANLDAKTLNAFVSLVFVDDALPLAQARSLLDEFAELIEGLPEDTRTDLYEFALTELDPRAHAFDTGVTTLRKRLALLHENAKRFRKAAEALRGIPLDGSGVDLDFKVGTYVKIARFYLLENQASDAETYVNLANAHISKRTKPSMKIQYLWCYARILDAKHRFIDAAMRYYHLSQLEPTAGDTDSGITSAERLEVLTLAATCAILAPAGPRRSRLLSLLYADERTRKLALFPLLESIHMERLVNAEQIREFSTTLQTHQKATMADGSTVLDKAVLMHNLMAASKLYANIRFEELGGLLGVGADVAEKMAADMIYEERINGVIDQVEGLVVFDEIVGPTGSILKWNAQIEGLCHAVDECTGAILKKYPQFAE